MMNSLSLKKLKVAVILASFLFIIVSCHSKKSTTTTLDGTWIPIKQEMGGKAIPKSVYKNQKLIIDGTSYSFHAESVDEGIATYKDGQMDIYSKEGANKGTYLAAIYKIDDGNLTICYNLAGDGYPKEFDTKARPTLFMCVFKKADE